MSRAFTSASEVFSSYLARSRDTPLLDAEQERRLGAAARGGARGARDHLVRANLRLVTTVAREFLGRGLGLEDLVGEGNVGLLRATDRYDPAYGTRFSTYASYWIKQAIREALVSTAEMVRLPAHVYKQLNRWRRAERTLTRELGRRPSSEEVAGRLGLSASQARLVSDARRARRVQGDGGSDGHGGGSLTEVVAAPAAPAGERLEAEDDRADLARRLGRLDARSRELVERRYGLKGREPQTFKEAGRAVGATRAWARKLEQRAVARLAEADAEVNPEEKVAERVLSAAARTRHGAGGTPRWSELAAVARELARPVWSASA